MDTTIIAAIISAIGGILAAAVPPILEHTLKRKPSVSLKPSIPRSKKWLLSIGLFIVISVSIFAMITSSKKDTPVKDASILIYGPNTGTIKHTDSGVYFPICATVDIQDFIAEVSFTNPYDWREYAWSYGIFFRSSSIHNNYRLTLRTSESHSVLHSPL